MCYVSVVKENETPGHTSDGWMNESKGPDAGVFFQIASGHKVYRPNS